MKKNKNILKLISMALTVIMLLGTMSLVSYGVGGSFTVTYQKNGGTGGMNTESLNEGSTYELKSCSFTAPLGYNFSHWEIEGVMYNPTDTITIKNNTVIKAVWAKTLNESDYEITSGIYTVEKETVLTNRLVINGDVTILIKNSAILNAPMGINVPESSSLTIDGDGYLYAEASHNKYACIGGNDAQVNGDIIINGCTVDVNNGIANDINKFMYGAGIGGGASARSGNITINGGTVRAKGNSGAAIGSGYSDSGTKMGLITINGGEIDAVGYIDAAAIGGGRESGSMKIVVNEGRVIATSNNGAGVGGSHNCTNTLIEINGGYVSADSKGAAAIGTGINGSATVKINGGNVFANSVSGAGIGGAERSRNKISVTITGGTVTATSVDGAGIGTGKHCTSVGSVVSIEGGKINSSSSSDGAGIGAGRGSGFDDKGCKVVITGGNILAEANEGAGIGAGSLCPCDVLITGGYVDTKSTHYGAGIGIGSNGVGGSVVITGGNIRATGNDLGYGIGKGYNSRADVTFSTGESGNAFITALNGPSRDTHSISDQSGKNNGLWQGVLLETRGENYKVYKNPVVKEEINLNTYGESMNIDAGTSLTALGPITGYGTIRNNGVLTVTDELEPNIYLEGTGVFNKITNALKTEDVEITNNLQYTGSPLDVKVKLTQSSNEVTWNIINWSLSFEKDNEICESIVDAGEYNAVLTKNGSDTVFKVGFTVEKAVPQITEFTRLSAVLGQKLSDINIPVSKKGTLVWHSPETVINNYGENVYKANFISKDSNYKNIENVSVTVVVKEMSVIHFVGNGGTGEMRSLVVENGSNIILPDCDFKPRAYCVFDGWNIDGNIYKAGETVSIYGNAYIKAQWKAQTDIADFNCDANVSVDDYQQLVNNALDNEVITKIDGDNGYLAAYKSDLNQDGAVDVLDIFTFQNTENKQELNSVNKNAGDFNKDGIVNDTDYEAIRDVFKNKKCTTLKPYEKRACDLDSNGIIDKYDTYIIEEITKKPI